MKDHRVCIHTLGQHPWWFRANEEGSERESLSATQNQCNSDTGGGNGRCGVQLSTDTSPDDFIERAKNSRAR